MTMKLKKLKKLLAILFALCFTLTACSKASTPHVDTPTDVGSTTPPTATGTTPPTDTGTISPTDTGTTPPTATGTTPPTATGTISPTDTGTTSPVATGNEAKIGDTGYATLQDAIKAAAEDDTVTLLTDVVLADPIYIGSDINFILDLNGKTIDGGSYMAIQHDGTGILNITDSSGGGVSIGQVKSAGDEDVATVGIGNGGHLVLADSAMITAGSGIAVWNVGSGSVFITGGDVNTTSGGTAIKNGEGDVTVAGGAVGATDGGYAIWNVGSGSVNVWDGSVYAEGRYCAAIYNFGVGSANVSGGTVSSDGSDSIAILNNDAGSVTIAGGMIRNNYDSGTAIWNDKGSVSILDGSIPIPDNSDSPVIIGGGMAMNTVPNLGNGVQATASVDTSGTPTTAYDEKNITEYRYLKFE